LGALLGLIYSAFSDGFGVLYPHVNTFIIGILVGALISYLEFYVFPEKGRSLKFMSLLLIRTVLYIGSISLIVFFVLLISRMIRLDMSFSQVLVSEDFKRYIFEEDFKVAIIYTVAFAFIINFSILMIRKMGKDVMWGIVTGKYYQPSEVERIFMFLSVRYSDQIVKKIGHLHFHKFLADFFYDITIPILEHRGTIYEYVDDLVVVSWKPPDGLQNANCIRTFYTAKEKVKESSERYYTNYGFVPKLIAGYHIGKVVRGELGEIKGSIVFFGDVMNTTSRIKEQCEVLEKDLLISAELKYRLTLPKIYCSGSCGEISLKGKQKDLELYYIKNETIANLESK
jgi:adenylate cyclase